MKNLIALCSNIYVVRSDGSDEQRLTDDCTLKGSQQWLPDGSGLIYTANPDDDACPLDYRGSSLNPVELEDASVSKLLPRGWYAGGATLSPAAKWVAFSTYSQRSETVDLFRVRIRDGAIRRITQNERKAHDVDPDW